jgi:hypothetical protein
MDLRFSFVLSEGEVRIDDLVLFRGHCEPGESYLAKVSLNKAQPDIDSWNLWTISKQKKNEDSRALRLTPARRQRPCRWPQESFLSLLVRGLRLPFTGGWREVYWS